MKNLFMLMVLCGLTLTACSNNGEDNGETPVETPQDSVSTTDTVPAYSDTIRPL
jgi:hypothetical protein